MTNLYAFFGCETKEELYQKVKDDEPSVRSLVDFIEYSKAVEINRAESITSPDSFYEAVRHEKMPAEGEAVCLFVNTKNIPVHVGRLNVENENSRKLILKEGLGAGATSLFLVENYHNNSNFDIHNYFEVIGLQVLDTMDYNRRSNVLKSRAESRPRPLDTIFDDQIAEANNAGMDYVVNLESKMSNIDRLEDFDDFSTYFAEQEIKGLNIFEDTTKVRESLKVGYQYDWQEAFGVISCDDKGDVLSVTELFKGATDASLVDSKVFAKELLTNPDTSKILIFHNHPSGNVSPSPEDFNITAKLNRISKTLDVDLMDHLIVGREGVYSFAKSSQPSIDRNEDYLDAIFRPSKSQNKKRLSNFNLER